MAGNSTASTIGVDCDEIVDGIGRRIKNLATGTNLAKSDLVNTKKSNFVKANFFGADFLTSKVKKAFTHHLKAFTEALILYRFELKCYIRIKTNALGYAISGILN